MSFQLLPSHALHTILLQVEVAIGVKDWLVQGLTPRHQWPGIQLHTRHSCTLHDERGKNGVFICHHSSTSTEALDDLDPLSLSGRHVDQLMRFPAMATVLSSWPDMALCPLQKMHRRIAHVARGPVVRMCISTEGKSLPGNAHDNCRNCSAVVDQAPVATVSPEQGFFQQ